MAKAARTQTLANASVINDAGFGDMDRTNTGRVRLQFTKTFRPDDFAFDAVGLASLEDPLHSGQLSLLEGDNDFPANFVGDAFLLTKFDESQSPLAAIDRFERAGLVINARVDHTRITTRLVLGQTGLFFEKDDFFFGKLFDQLVCSGQPDNASANNYDLCALHADYRWSLARTGRLNLIG